jgi:hypothetical protein
MVSVETDDAEGCVALGFLKKDQTAAEFREFQNEFRKLLSHAIPHVKGTILVNRRC